MNKVIEKSLEFETELEYYCPLLKEKISASYCYDINSVAFGLCKPSLIHGNLKSNDLCLKVML